MPSFSNNQDSEPFEKRPRNGNMAETVTAGISKESPPEEINSLETELDILQDKLDAELMPLYEKDEQLRTKFLTCGQNLDSLRKKLVETTDSNEKAEVEEQILNITELLNNLKSRINGTKRDITKVKAKYEPNIRKLQLQVQDKVLARLPLESKYDVINKRLKAITEFLKTKKLELFSKLCGKPAFLKGIYRKSDEAFFPQESPIQDGAFEYFSGILHHFLERMPICSYDFEMKRVFLSLPFFLCAMNGMDSQYQLNVEVSIIDEDIDLNGKADIIIYCGDIEIIVVEEKRGSTSNQETGESAIPQALVGMDCLLKKRLSAKRPGFQADKPFSFGIVTDCVHWYFLKLQVDGTYSVSFRYDLPPNIFGEGDSAHLLRGICMRIRGVIEEATS